MIAFKAIGNSKVKEEKMNYKCTIISISNNKKITDEFIVNLSEQKNVSYQLIVIDNRNNIFNGARGAFNSVLGQIENEIVIFSHPDIRFLSDNALSSILENVKKIDDYGVIGVAGCKEGIQWKLLSNIKHGKLKKDAGEKIADFTEVQTVDECFFVMKKEVIKRVQFTKLSGWHLYAVEQCLRMINEGKRNYIIPADLWHISDGKSLDPQYMICLEQVLKLYKENIEFINSTVKQWKTHGRKAWLYRKYYFYKQIVKKRLIG